MRDKNRQDQPGQLPTFVIAGAQKAGTSSLAATLRKHPEIFVSRPKELHFFDRHWAKGLDWYQQNFPAKPRHRAVGEGTPSYLFDPVVRERMHDTLPEARILISLREPVSRAYSHYWHQRRIGNEPTETFEEALANEEDRSSAKRVKRRVRHAYVARGRYLEQLQGLEELYGRDRIHVLLFEDFIDDRVETLRRILRFLEVDETAADTMPEAWRNRFRTKDDDSAKARPAAYPEIAPETAARLHEVFREGNDRLGEWLGRDLSHWNRES